MYKNNKSLIIKATLQMFKKLQNESYDIDKL